MTDETPDFRLGKIEANTNHLVTAVDRLTDEVGSVGQRLLNTESRVTAIEVERAVMLEGYKKFVHKTNEHMMIHEGWRASSEGERKGFVASGRLIVWVSGLIPGGVIVGGLMRLFGS